VKKFVAAIILGVILTMAGIVFGAGLKIGYVDVASIFDQFSETKRAKLALEKEIKAKGGKISKSELNVAS
jgi:Skp family chaperone for outer membrane proteins